VSQSESENVSFAKPSAGGWRRWLGSHELGLAVLLAIEVAIFARIGRHFWSVNNAFEILRLSVEIGLLALVMTPVIVSGGIDLSVGSLMGLSAVLFGKLWRDAGLPIPVAILLTLGIGAAAGGLNGLFVTRLRIPPLIVTLGTYSLFRGLAEGISKGGVDSVTGLPDSFTNLGQGYFFGVIPMQLPVFLAVALGVWILLHRMTVGRGWQAIGYSPEGARHAGIPVERRLMAVYILAGTVASLAAIIYVARIDQAKADAGTRYELLAITAVVLGGTSIFGGSGNIHGTLLGLFVIAVLKNGLLLSDLPAELGGVLVGLLLLGSISLNQIVVKLAARRRAGGHGSKET